jgi:tight adherence protein C
MDGTHHPFGGDMTVGASVVAIAVVAGWLLVPGPPPRERLRVPVRVPVAAVAVILGVAGALAVPGATWLGLPCALLPLAHRHLRRGRDRRAAADGVSAALPEVVDLLALAVGAGLTPAAAVDVVGRRGAGPVAAVLADARRRAVLEQRLLADALDDAHHGLGAGADAARPLLAALADACRHGTALGPSLERIGAEARVRRRHRAEARARRVPVLLLFPLVTCTLPALGLLTVAPILVGTLRSLRA